MMDLWRCSVGLFVIVLIGAATAFGCVRAVCAVRLGRLLLGDPDDATADRTLTIGMVVLPVLSVVATAVRYWETRAGRLYIGRPAEGWEVLFNPLGCLALMYGCRLGYRWAARACR